ncbi:CRISPR-associated helicase/endonuclease Cas3 [Arcobacter sp. L]|uniref:CRISPR-associated helicase/endonuclease Cas3 n=1 Tax=Arcobacter sp. L TaxID=944547 RepID=UPI000229650D|nr:CRISPR-associated helicase/endonuclease Cas3 [Arcobacter sp. L]BAK73770.1 CRISPR-associated protein [Arcobacter sp. L]
MLAKSDGLSLEQHIQDLLDVSLDFKLAFPLLQIYFDDVDFWDYLNYSILFHDLGKATKGFQSLMQNNKPYRFRHEIISALVAQNYTNDELIINAILAHHKNFEKLKELLNEYENNKKYNQDRWIDKEFEELDLEWVQQFLSEKKFEKKDSLVNNIDENIKKWTSRRARKKISELEKFQNIFLSASLSICDHNASAGIKNIPIIEQNNFNFLYNKKHKPYHHQEVSWREDGNALLIAPTGQGKTESSLGWLQNQLKNRQGRAFYILPFTASINAMTKRVSSVQDGFGNEELVGLLHGKAKFFIDEYYEKKDGQSLKDLLDINKKIIKPFKVVTPFQILKWAFGVKGFEKGFTELAGSYLIFDEIHIYDKELFRRILFFIEWLIDKLHVKVFIMTATMPTFMQNHIKQILNIKNEIRPSKEDIATIQRHKIKLLNFSIDEQKDFIQTKINDGKTVVVVCNTVVKAQEIYASISCDYKTLLHSGFNAKDRTQKEKEVQSKNKPQLLVGTQAIEVSLDIDYDLIVTEPAPLDALLQRFGRVYRSKSRLLQESDEANCYVTTMIEDVHKIIYDNTLIKNTLKVLEKIQNIVINEDMVQDLLDEIYEPFALNEDNLREDFRSLLDNLYPFNVYEESEEKFFEQFDGVEVLPIELFDEFNEYVKDQQYLEAEKLFVSISKNKYKKYRYKKDLIKFVEPHNYGKAFPLIGLKYSCETGLLDEEVTDISNKSMFI